MQRAKMWLQEVESYIRARIAMGEDMTLVRLDAMLYCNLPTHAWADCVMCGIGSRRALSGFVASSFYVLVVEHCHNEWWTCWIIIKLRIIHVHTYSLLPTAYFNTP